VVAGVLFLKRPPTPATGDTPAVKQPIKSNSNPNAGNDSTENGNPIHPVNANPNPNVNPSSNPNNTNVNPAANPNAVIARPGSDEGAGPLRVSVLKFKNVGNDPNLSSLELGIGETALSEMGANAKGVRFIERANLDEDIAEIDRAGDVHFNPQEVAKLGRLQGAQVAVLGGFQKAGSQLRITARFVRVENGQILDSLTVTQPARNPLKAQDEVARGLTKKLVELAAKWGRP
jgi:TolB-like protein